MDADSAGSLYPEAQRERKIEAKDSNKPDLRSNNTETLFIIHYPGVSEHKYVIKQMSD